LKQIELLAPAGDMESLDAAIRFGANAIYVGGPFMQLRAKKTAFTEEMLQSAVQKCHAHGCKLYVTVNSFAKNPEIPLLESYACFLKEIGIDAVIVSDIGVLKTIHAAVPDLDIHISTQANCMNYAAAQVYQMLGAKRIIVARELSIDEIAQMRKELPDDLELESFVHGAMCMSYSGRCLLSAYLNDRSGNRGECTQPCRWNYRLMEEKRPGEYFPIYEDEDGTSILSSQDLNCAPILQELIDAGICSLKIEGRMKSAYYVATVVNAYRRLLDKTLSLEEAMAELDCISHRKYFAGFYHGSTAKYATHADDIYTQTCTFIGIVEKVHKGKIFVRQRNYFSEGDQLEVLSPYSFGESFTVKNLQNEEGQPINRASLVMSLVTMDCPLSLHEGDILRIRGKR